MTDEPKPNQCEILFNCPVAFWDGNSRARFEKCVHFQHDHENPNWCLHHCDETLVSCTSKAARCNAMFVELERQRVITPAMKVADGLRSLLSDALPHIECNDYERFKYAWPVNQAIAEVDQMTDNDFPY
jgi:hypothetical protein